MKAIIVYYSFEGSTALLAETMAEASDLPMLRLQPVKEISGHGFSKFFWGGKQVMMKQTPQLEDIKIDLSLFDTIILGTPVWASTYAPAIRSLLESGLVRDKNVYLFITHEGGPGKTIEKTKALLAKFNNTLISSSEYINVRKHPGAQKEAAIKWIHSIMQ